MPATDSLGVFWGEFLTHPVPLELSFGTCGYDCAYCFAGLNKAHRNADPGQALRLIRDRHERTTLEAHLLAQGYPVCVSNRTDPFAPRNAVHSLPVLQVMAETGIPVFIQTKGGDAAYKALDFLPPSVWYVSVSFTDDALRKRLEPSTPSLAERWALIEKVVAAGSSAIVGLNPYVPQWVPDPDLLFVKAKECGTAGVVMEELHLNTKQVAAMTPHNRAAVSDEIIRETRRRKYDEADIQRHIAVFRRAEEFGLEVAMAHRWWRSDFDSIFRRHYAKTFPTSQDFVNAVADSGADIFSFADFWGVLKSYLPAGKFRLHHYLGSMVHQLTERTKMPPRMTYGDLVEVLWRNPQDVKKHPAWSFGFALATEKGTDNEVGLVDENGLPWVVYDPAGNFREGRAEYTGQEHKP